MVVAQVNDAVITLSELVAQTGLVLLRSRGPRVATEAALTRDLLASVLDAAVNEVLLFQEVRRLQLSDVSDVRMNRAYARDRRELRRRGMSMDFARTYGFEPLSEEAPPPLWAALLRRQLAVEAFLMARSRLEIRPSATLVLRCYELNPEVFGGRAFSDAEPEIRARIREQIEARTAAELVDDLRRRASIRITAGFELSSREPLPDEASFTCPLDSPA